MYAPNFGIQFGSYFLGSGRSENKKIENMSKDDNKPTKLEQILPDPSILIATNYNTIRLDDGLRHRIPWGESSSNDIPILPEVKDLLEDDDDTSCLAEEEDGMGCPLPSTPE